MTKAKIIAVTPSGAKFGPNKDKDIFLVVTDPASPGGVYKTFHQNLHEKIGQELEFNVREEEYKGKKEYILETEKREGGNRFGGGARGKSPEELAFMREDMHLRYDSMHRSFAKDIIVALIGQGWMPKKDAELKTKFDWLVDVVQGSAPKFKSDQPDHAEVSADDIPF